MCQRQGRDQGSRAQDRGARHAVGSTCRVEPNLLRMLAANARFLLFTHDERRRLKAMRDKYSALLPFVNHRNDLTYLLGELIGELNNGHTYVGGGERPETPRIKLGLLGAELSSRPSHARLSHRNAFCRAKIGTRKPASPLTDVGVDVKPGDYILAINNTPVSSFTQSLRTRSFGTADKQSGPARECQAD